MTNYWIDKSVLICGGSGFVGIHLTTLLRNAGASVTVLDNFSRGQNKIPRVRYLFGDCSIEGTCRDWFKNQQIVFNLAAEVAGVQYNQSHHAEMFRLNLNAQMMPLRIAAEYGVEKFLHTSSVCIYSPHHNNPCQEHNGFEGTPTGANIGYSLAKRMGERYAMWVGDTGLDVVRVRPSNIYGPCFSEDTSILTVRGYKNIKKVKTGDWVYTLNPDTHCVEPSQVTHTQVYYTNELFYFRGRSVDFKVTSDHKMYFRTYGNSFQKTSAEYFRKRAGNQYGQVSLAIHNPYFGQTWSNEFSLVEFLDSDHIVKNGEARDGKNSRSKPFLINYDIQDWIEFLGWYITEGCAINGKSDCKQIRITQSKECNFDNYNRIRLLLTRMKIPFGYDGKSFYFTSRLIRNYLESEIGIGARNKNIPEFIFETAFPNKLRVLLLKILMLGDGTKYRSRYTTASNQLKNDFMHLCFLLGLMTNARREKEVWRIHIYNKNRNPCIKYHNISIENTTNELVYCFTTAKNNIVFAGRNNKYNWIGQCDYDDEKAHVIPALIRKCVYDDEIIVNGTGQESREFIYVTDVARGMMAAVERGKPGEVYNLGTNATTCVSISYLVNLIREIAGKPEKRIRFAQQFDAGDNVRWSDAVKANTELDWYHQVGIVEGLERTVRWYLNRKDQQ